MTNETTNHRLAAPAEVSPPATVTPPRVLQALDLGDDLDVPVGAVCDIDDPDCEVPVADGGDATDATM